MADAAALASTGLLDVWIYPRVAGEVGAHRFHFFFNPSGTDDPVPDGSKIWIRFDPQLYDYYLGAAYLAYEGAVDEEGHPKYLIDCIVMIGSNVALQGVECQVKRHSMIMVLT